MMAASRKSTLGDARRRPPELLYAVDEWPPPTRLALLGLQYAALDATYLILVAIILRNAEIAEADRVALMGIGSIALAIGTALQALPRGPVGSGFLAPPVFSATYLAPSVLAAQLGGMPLVFGMTLFAGLVEIMVALALFRLRVLVTPVLSGLTVFVVGLQLGVVGIGEMLDVSHVSRPDFPLHLAVTTLTLSVCVALSIWGRGVPRLLGSMLGLLAGLTAAWNIGLIEEPEVRMLGGTVWIALPWPPVLERSFDFGLAPAFFAAGVAAALRAVGVVTTCQRINDAAWRRPDLRNIRKGVLADGLGTLVGGIIGAPGMSIAPSLVGISGATGATSRAIAFAAAAILLGVGLSPRLAGAFLLVPSEVAGSLLVFTACFMIAGGMTIMLSRPTDTRAVYVIGTSTLLALSENVFPNYFQALPPAVRTITASPLALGLTAALLLTLLFRLGTRRNAGIDWRSGAAGSIAAAVDFLRAQANGWKVEAQTVETSAAEAQEVLDYILRASRPPSGGSLRAVQDGGELRVEIRYRGDQLPKLLEENAAPPAVPRGGELENEEAAAYVGLRTFIQGLAADRKEVRRRGGEIVVRLVYAV
jgi:xanthine permease XanP